MPYGIMGIGPGAGVGILAFNSKTFGLASPRFVRARMSGAQGTWNSGRIQVGWGFVKEGDKGFHAFRVI